MSQGELMTTQNVSISLDTYQDIYIQKIEGKMIPVVHNSIFFQNAEEAVLSQETPLTRVLDKFIEMNTVPNGTITEEQRKELLKQMYSILSVVEEKIEAIENLPEWSKEDY